MLTNTNPSLLILGAGGFVGTYIRGLCDVLDVRYIGTSRGCQDGLLSFDAADSSHWIHLAHQLKNARITAVIDLISPNVSPARRLAPIQPSLYTYPEHLLQFASRNGAQIVHVSTDLSNRALDSYSSFKDITLRSFLAGQNDTQVIIAPRLIGVGLSQDFLAGLMVQAAVDERPLVLEDPGEVRGFLSVRSAVQEILHAALRRPRENRPNFQAEREYLSTADFHSRVLGIHERLKTEGGAVATMKPKPPALHEWTRKCWNAMLELQRGHSRESLKAHSYTLDEELEAMFRHGES